MPRGRSFVSTLLRLSDDPQARLRVVNDQHCTPSYVRHIVRAVLFLLDSGHCGTFHVVNGGETTWHSFAARCSAWLAKRCMSSRSRPSSTGLPQNGHATASWTRGSTGRSGGPELPMWQDALAEFLRTEAGFDAVTQESRARVCECPAPRKGRRSPSPAQTHRHTIQDRPSRLEFLGKVSDKTRLRTTCRRFPSGSSCLTPHLRTALIEDATDHPLAGREVSIFRLAICPAAAVCCGRGGRIL